MYNNERTIIINLKHYMILIVYIKCQIWSIYFILYNNIKSYIIKGKWQVPVLFYILTIPYHMIIIIILHNFNA